MGYESSAERWSPVQSVEKILLSVVSMLAGTEHLLHDVLHALLHALLHGLYRGRLAAVLRLKLSRFLSSEPNDESGANVDASKMWREDREQFYKLAQKIVRKSLGL